jgi:K+-sensing histidine kinase KdpD
MSLRITELQSADKQLMSERIELNKLIGYSLFQMDERIRSKQIRFLNEKSNEMFYVFGESQLLKACFMILFDFLSERNHANSEVRISFDKLDRGVVIIISDEGPFLSQTEQDAVFDIFNMGMRSLSLAKIIVEAHHGEFGVYNNPNGGISLTFSLFSNE